MPNASPPNLAIYYHPDGFDTKNRPLMGRRAAGKSFLDAWIARRGDDPLYCCAGDRRDFQQFVEQAKAHGRESQSRWLRLDRIESLAEVGTLFFPGPDIGVNAWRRFRRDPRSFSIIGITHTICTKAVMDGIAEWLVAPVEDWDAVICTSHCVRESVSYLLAAQREHLARRTGATRFIAPQLPVIPLAIDTAKFAPDANLRSQTRAGLGIGADDFAFLFVGRLSIYGKAHPAPMFIALERAALKTGKALHLILAGWFATKGLREAFDAMARRMCPSVKLHVVDGRDETALAGAWRAGDVFVSMVDNVQETFGLTPVEAMAAGLPVVVSDWDGYRDTVRHGVDGFRIPTQLAPPAFGEILADRYAAGIDSYDFYLARTTYNVVVEVDAAVAAFATLIDDPNLRKRMGESGRQRAVAHYDWRSVLGAYEQLAGALAGRRKAAQALESSVRRVWPARLSPFEMFANYPTRIPAATDSVQLAAADVEAALGHIAIDINPSLDHAESLMKALRDFLVLLGGGEKTVAALLEDCSPAIRMQRIGLLLRLAKFGVVSITPQEGPTQPRPGPGEVPPLSNADKDEQ